MEISKVSEITVEYLEGYLRIADPSDFDKQYLATIISAAKTYMAKYTGLDVNELDKSTDFVIAALALCQDMYDNRTIYADGSNVNLTVSSILDMHSVNLLPSTGGESA